MKPGRAVVYNISQEASAHLYLSTEKLLEHTLKLHPVGQEIIQPVMHALW